MSTKSPFATRAEEIGDKLFDYFVPPNPAFYGKLFNDKAAVLVGGRGTGKTMVLKSLAFEYRAKSQGVEWTWQNEQFLGCYLRINTNTFSNFRGRGLQDEEWDDLFAHYFNLEVAIRIAKVLRTLYNSGLVEESSINKFTLRYGEVIGDSDSSLTLDQVQTRLRVSLYEFIRHMNNPHTTQRPILVNNGTLIFELCDALKDAPDFRDRTWFILLDEYENLADRQQRIINTLIKANQPPVIFKIAIKPGGWWTQETTIETECLQETADFDIVDLESGFTPDNFKNLVVKVLRKTLSMRGITDEEFLDVRSLLPDLSPEDEARLVVKNSHKDAGVIERIRRHMRGVGESTEETEALEGQLIDPADPLRTRVHLVLLDRGIPPNRIAKERILNSSKYREWYKHNSLGTLFLLCSEHQTRKLFSGFETYILLSSKIIRNFITLFARAWELSMDEKFSVSTLRPFSPEIQSRAAYYVSKEKVFQIRSYANIGPALSIFTNQIGRIFEALNKDAKQRQPERNHFSIKGQPSAQSTALIRGALLFSVLQETAATKIRSDVDVRGGDYLINRIYCPYYHISYRKKHKLELNAHECDSLVSGSNSERIATAKAILKRLKHNEYSDERLQQVTLFDLEGGD